MEAGTDPLDRLRDAMSRAGLDWIVDQAQAAHESDLALAEDSHSDQLAVLVEALWTGLASASRAEQQTAHLLAEVAERQGQGAPGVRFAHPVGLRESWHVPVTTSEEMALLEVVEALHRLLSE